MYNRLRVSIMEKTRTVGLSVTLMLVGASAVMIVRGCSLESESERMVQREQSLQIGRAHV